MEAKREHQAWVGEHFRPKMAWDPEFWSARLGTPHEGYIKDVVRHAFRAYYYPDADLTLMVNISRGWLLFYNIGRAPRGVWPAADGEVTA